jgi:small subunit ribosomal protein S16
MLAIRMQRTGRKGHAMFRMVVQDSHLTPTSGKVVARLGSYDPHAKVATLDKEKASFYLKHGAQPSDRAARLLASEGVKLPDWVQTSAKKEGKLRNPEKLRKNQSEKPTEPEAAEEPKKTEPPEPDTPEESEETADEATPETKA